MHFGVAVSDSFVTCSVFFYIQEALKDPVLKPKRALTTRWLSHDHACTTMRQIITSVIISLQREVTERCDAKATGLLRLVANWKFVATLYAMCDILPQLTILSKSFQVRSFPSSVILLRLLRYDFYFSNSCAANSQ